MTITIEDLLRDGFKEYKHPFRKTERFFQKEIADDQYTKYFINALWEDFSDLTDVLFNWTLDFEARLTLKNGKSVELKTSNWVRERRSESIALSDIYSLFEEYWQSSCTYLDR